MEPIGDFISGLKRGLGDFISEEGDLWSGHEESEDVWLRLLGDELGYVFSGLRGDELDALEDLGLADCGDLRVVFEFLSTVKDFSGFKMSLISPAQVVLSTRREAI